MPTVAVLMSTYNGEKYIREQLDSIFKQKDVDVKLFVRDDGSTDNTIKILEEYKQKYPVTIVIDGENVGPGESFMRLVYQYAEESDTEYYAFADQDDIWLEDKLQVAIETIEKKGTEKYLLYSSNQFIYIDGEKKGNRHKETQKTDLVSHLTQNTIAGCTFVFNKHLARLVANAQRPDKQIIKYRIHDSWMMLIATSCGQVIYDDSSHMLYRIHNNNAVGLKEISIRERTARLKRYFVKRDDSNLRMITAQNLIRLFPEINGENRYILSLYAEYQESWSKKIKLLKCKDITEKCLENPLIFAIKVITNFV